MLQNHLYEKDPGGARDVPGAPWNPRDPLGMRLRTLGTPLGRPGTPLGPLDTPLGRLGTPLGPLGTSWEPPGTPLDAPGTPGTSREPLRTTKTFILQQTDSARCPRLLCSNLLVGAHRMKDSTGPFYA